MWLASRRLPTPELDGAPVWLGNVQLTLNVLFPYKFMDMEKYHLPRSQDSSVSIVTGWKAGVRFLVWARYFFPLRSSWGMKQTTGQEWSSYTSSWYSLPLPYQFLSLLVYLIRRRNMATASQNIVTCFLGNVTVIRGCWFDSLFYLIFHLAELRLFALQI
jgi:hypothetical protein